MVSKLQEELEKARTQNQQLEAQMRTRELEAKQKLESMRTQAVFSVSNTASWVSASADNIRTITPWRPHRKRDISLSGRLRSVPAPRRRCVGPL